MFSTLPCTNFKFSAVINLSSANALNFDKSKILSFGKELNIVWTRRGYTSKIILQALCSTMPQHEFSTQNHTYLWENVFYAVFNNIPVISRRQLTLFMSFLGFTSTRLGSEVSCSRTLPRKKHRRSSAAPTQDPWITSQTPYHWATWDPIYSREENS